MFDTGFKLATTPRVDMNGTILYNRHYILYTSFMLAQHLDVLANVCYNGSISSMNMSLDLGF